MSVQWANPYALLLLLTLPIYPLLARRAQRAVPLPRVGEMLPGERRAILFASLPAVLRLLLLGTLVLVIAGPSTAGAVVEERTEGIPIMLVVDISSSMLARDFQPQDRLSVAKETISEFVERRADDPVGLVALAGEALTLVPPTTRRSILQSAIATLQVGLLEDGTAIGDGLAAAVNRVRDLGGEEKVIVLLSDGESNRGRVDPLAAAEAAATLGIQVHAVGIGSEGVAAVPIGSAPAGFEYAEQPVGLDEALLRQIAETTGGNYYRATDPQALQQVYTEIDALVPSLVETTRRVERVEWAGPILLLSAMLFVGEWVTRSSRWGAIP
ncbi:MAG: VWA domain-containing protein [Gemmatimonas sp.]|nr:VWA domain-containing protein [Gemmatimonas sp.]